MTEKPVGVLLMAYGGPLSLDDVAPYLANVRGGRPTPPELVQKVKARYARIGGGSPLLAYTLAQAMALEKRLNEGSETHFRTFVGMRHWHPYIRDAVAGMVAAGVEKLVAIPMAPHYSRLSVGAYHRPLAEALDGLEAAPPRVTFVERYGSHPRFVAAVAGNVRQALEHFPAESREQVTVIFTAHSIPQRAAVGDPYAGELQESARLVADAAGVTSWQFAYQSAGARAGAWLGPDVGDLLAQLADRGVRNVLVVPIGFVCDHVEILYDIDVELAEKAKALGVRMERSPSLNASPAFIDALAALVRESWDADNAART